MALIALKIANTRNIVCLLLKIMKYR